MATQSEAAPANKGTSIVEEGTSIAEDIRVLVDAGIDCSQLWFELTETQKIISARATLIFLNACPEHYHAKGGSVVFEGARALLDPREVRAILRSAI